tara:strand:+ start:360 stop:545 length:186 start_codon:yes stop_codon:yes gene_type:complete
MYVPSLQEMVSSKFGSSHIAFANTQAKFIPSGSNILGYPANVLEKNCEWITLTGVLQRVHN